jgi:ribose transport system permease protein
LFRLYFEIRLFLLMWPRIFSDYGMLFVLLTLCAVLSIVTYGEQFPGGAAGGEALAYDVVAQTADADRVLIIGRATADDAAFADALAAHLKESGRSVIDSVRGDPRSARRALERAAAAPDRPHVIAATKEAGDWDVLHDVGRHFPSLANARVMVPRSYSWPYFLRPVNLVNIANQIAIIAIVAVGMTMVILTGGIDLSVGSLVALSAVLATLLIRDCAGAESASAAGMTICCLAAILACGMIGLVNGLLITLFEAPPFIITLGMMLIARGLAYILSGNESIFQVPQAFTVLGVGTVAGGVPNAVVLTLGLYLVAHLVMAHTTLGRYVYAIGSNVKAARYSGVPVQRIVVLVYIFSGFLAGLGGIIMASQLRSAAPTYAQMYELYVIVAVVIGGTSLSGGEGKVLGTLIGALLIAVVQNGMNLLSVESRAQMVVLGSVLIAAVILDRLKRRSWGWFRGT